MFKYVLSACLLLGSLAGISTAAESTHKCGDQSGTEFATLIYGPYFYSDARAVQNDLSLRGFWTQIVLGGDGFYYVYAW